MKYLGNYSAVDPVYSRMMYCDDCNVSWIGCWDNFECPKCHKGELPRYKSLDEIMNEISQIHKTESVR